MRAILPILLLVYSVPLAAQTRGALVIAVLRQDGIAVPFAHRDGSSWLRVESATEENARLASDRWYWPTASHVRVLDGGAAVRLSIGEVSLDYDLWGQITTLAPQNLRQGSGFVPRLGVVFNQPVEAIPFVPVDIASTPTGRQLLEQVERIVARHSSAENLGALRLPLVVEAVRGLAEPIGELEVYWVDAVKPLTGGEPMCPLQLSVSIGIAREKETWRVLDERAVRTDCDGKEASGYIVYAALKGSPVLLVAEEMGWEQTEKQLLRLTPAGLERVLDR